MLFLPLLAACQHETRRSAPQWGQRWTLGDLPAKFGVLPAVHGRWAWNFESEFLERRSRRRPGTGRLRRLPKSRRWFEEKSRPPHHCQSSDILENPPKAGPSPARSRRGSIAGCRLWPPPCKVGGHCRRSSPFCRSARCQTFAEMLNKKSKWWLGNCQTKNAFWREIKSPHSVSCNLLQFSGNYIDLFE